MPNPIKGRAGYLRLGDWNAQCSMCGKKRKASYLVRNWQGLYRCPEHNEPRQPQDFVRVPQDNQLPPFVQVNTYNYVYVCDPAATTAIAGVGVAGCMMAGYVSPAYDPTVTD